MSDKQVKKANKVKKAIADPKNKGKSVGIERPQKRMT